MDVAVIGCGGFIGSHLVERLLQEGYRISGWDYDSGRISSSLSHPNMTFTRGDFIPHVEDITKQHKVVIHLAALCNPSLYNTVDEQVIQSNFQHASMLAESCAQNKAHLVYFSTSEVYGRTLPGQEATPLNEDSSSFLLGSVSARRWSYSCAKQLMERYLVALEASRGLSWTTIRPFNFIGPHMDFIPGIDGEGIPRVLACFMDAWLHGKPIQLVDGGKNQRAFTWIGDAVNAISLLLQHLPTVKGHCLNIGHPQNEVTIAQLATLVQKLAEEWKGLYPIPAVQNISAEEFYGVGYEDSNRRLPDITKARTLLGWEPKVSLEIAMRDTMAWYSEYYGAKT